MSFFIDWVNEDLLGPIPMLVWIIGSSAVTLLLGIIGMFRGSTRRLGLLLLVSSLLFAAVAAGVVVTAIDGKEVAFGRAVLFLNNAVIYVFGTGLVSLLAIAVCYGLYTKRAIWVVAPVAVSLIGVVLAVGRQSLLQEELVNHIVSEPAESQFAHGPGYRRPHEIQVSDGMVLVPAGPFLMGSMSSYQTQPIVLSPDGDERPMRSHYLDTFLIDMFEVTNAEFRGFVKNTEFVTDSEVLDRGRRWAEDGWHDQEGLVWYQPRYDGDSIEDRDNHPVVQVSWNDAVAFCDWAGKRLPTEAEWEKAARGPFGQQYPWGEEFDPGKLNYCDTNCDDLPQFKDNSGDDGYRWTAPVGSYPEGRSYYGAYDMAGNVWEWVQDAYGPYYYYYSPYLNPSGPKVKGFERRVVRGGSFTSERGYSRSSIRSYDPPEISFFGVGFRCAKDAD